MHDKQSDTQAMTTIELRKFGLVTGALIIFFIGGFLPWLGHKDILSWQKITLPLGGVLILWALIHAESLVWVHKPWMFIAEKIGWVNTRIILAIFFYVILMPVGMMMRMAGKDPMARRFDAQIKSYRIVKEPQLKEHMETPY